MRHHSGIQGETLAGPPRQPIELPAVVQAVAGTDRVRCVWKNEAGGLTFELSNRAMQRFLKWAPLGSGIDIGAEVARLDWAVHFTSVPRYIDRGKDHAGTWLVTDPVPGESDVSERWKREPRAAVIAIGEGLRGLHDALPVDDCPFSWSAPSGVSHARQRAALGQIDPAAWHPEHPDLSVGQALDKLANIPLVDRAVVCQGDACAPNKMLRADGCWSGHVDLGAMGVADRWADLAVATWSTTWNYGPGWEEELLAAYGVTPDPVCAHYYRLLWDAGP